MDSKTKEFLQKLKDSGNWNDDYDYSEVKYRTIKSHVIIKFIELGTKHSIPPQGLFRGTKCIVSNAVNKEDFSRKIFNKVHGTKYNYTKFEFVDTKSKSTIICPQHKEFKQSYQLHVNGAGCPKCGIKKSSDFKRYDTASVLNKIKENNTWDENIDYSKIQFENSLTKLMVINKDLNTEHDVPFSSLLKGVALNIVNARDKNKYFIAVSNKVHNNYYDYSKTNYKNSTSKIIISCPKHGDFQIRAVSHQQGIGCKLCGIEKSRPKIIPFIEILKNFKEVHGDKYDYSKVKYIDGETKVKIICKSHGIFEQSPNAHKRGSGCYVCAIGWRKNDISKFVNNIYNQDVLKMEIGYANDAKKRIHLIKKLINQELNN